MTLEVLFCIDEKTLVNKMTIGLNNGIVENKNFIVHDIYQQVRYIKNVYILVVVKIF